MQKMKNNNWWKVFLGTFLVFNLFLVGEISAQTTNSTTTGGQRTISFTNPITADSIEKFLINAMGVLKNVIGIIAVFMIVVAGVIYVTSAGGKNVELAKSIATSAMIGLAIVLAAPSFLKEIYTVLGKEDKLKPIGTGENQVVFDKGLYEITLKATTTILGFIGVLTILMIIVGGVMLITSGDSDRTKTAKKIITSAMIGLIIALLSLVMVKAITGIFVSGVK